MLSSIKKIVNRIKFKFIGANNQQFEFEGQEVDYLPNDDELDLDYKEEITVDHIVNQIDEVQPREYCFEVKKLDRSKKIFLLKGIYGVGKGKLIHILINTRKPRIKKKLIKRIME